METTSRSTRAARSAAVLGSLTVLTIVLLAGPARADVITSLSFNIFTSNGAYYDNPGLEIYFDLSDVSGKPRFEFHNASLFECSVTRIYFDDALGLLAGAPVIDQSAGVDFETPTKPSNLPAGKTLTPPFVADFSAGSTPPISSNGVEPGTPEEWVALTFDLADGASLAQVVDALASRDLRVGIHIQSFPDGSSESATDIPEPATAALAALGILGFALRRRRR